ncbi:MAG: GntR family transcriptional regulator [Phycisphaeraceae bacterium]|nr:GntR family transcriptional regulator [Phycisphaeraceae bacterium]
MSVTLEHRAYTHLRQKLLSRSLAPGVALREAVLGKEVGVSRTPMRQAIRRLEREGLVVQVPGLGAFIKEPSAQEMRQAMETRLALERASAAYAARRITPGLLAELQFVVRQMRQVARVIRDAGGCDISATHRQQFHELDERFHQFVLQAADNQQMLRIVSEMQLLHQFFSGMAVPPITGANAVKHIARMCREHYKIMRAIAAGDTTRAAQSMSDHLERALQDWTRFMDAQSGR